jgi:tetratricopeptide (TPR) repeat protein
LGFRQFQTLDLSAWKGRRTPRQLETLLSDVADMGVVRNDQTYERKVTAPVVTASPARRGLIFPIVALGAAVAIGSFWLIGNGQDGPPTVAVTAADSSQASKILARNVLFRLGSLDGGTATNIRLLDEQDTGGADLRISVNAAESSDRMRANIALVAPSQKSVLWSEEFEQPRGHRAELEEAMAFAAGRVLGCAIEETSGKNGRLSAEMRRLYLTACSSVSEVGWDTRLVVPQFRRIIEESPKFRPAWAKLLSAEREAVSYLELARQDPRPTRTALAKDIAAARKIDPNMAEATLAEMELVPNRAVDRSIELVDKAKAQEPTNPAVLVTRSGEMQRVGRMRDAVDDADQAAKLDPLSASARANLISVLLYSGQAERARAELAKAKQLWPGARTISEAEYSS